MKEISHATRKELYQQIGMKPNKSTNIHHITFKSDIKRGLVPRNFPISARENLIPLPIVIHRELHELVERTPAYRTNIDSRIWLANYAFNGELYLL